MTTAREYDPVRATTDIVSDDGRTIPAGTRGTAIDAKPDGTCLAEFAFSPQTAETTGDFVQAVLTEGQYEVIQAGLPRSAQRADPVIGTLRCPAEPGGGGAPGEMPRLRLFGVVVGEVPGDLGLVAGVVDLLGAGGGAVAAEVLPFQAVAEEDPDLAGAPAADRDRLLVFGRLTGGQVGGVHRDLEHQRVDHAQVPQGRVRLLGGGPR